MVKSKERSVGGWEGRIAEECVGVEWEIRGRPNCYHSQSRCDIQVRITSDRATVRERMKELYEEKEPKVKDLLLSHRQIGRTPTSSAPPPIYRGLSHSRPTNESCEG